MFQTDQATAVSSIPTPAAAGTPGYFTGGNPGTGTPATIVDNDWLNMIQQELVNVAVGGGQTLSKTTYNQVLLAIKTLIAQPQTNLVTGVVGSTRNLKANLAAAATSIPFTADEIIVESALGGLRYCLANFSQTLNGAATGLGGLDTGALAANSFYAIYAAQTSAGAEGIFAQLEPAGGATSVYGGAHLPAGVIATALIGVWPTNGSSQFIAGYQRGSRFYYQSPPNCLVGGAATTPTAVSVSALVPVSALDYKVTISSLNAVSTSGGGVIVQTFIEEASGVGYGQFGYQINGQGNAQTVSIGGTCFDVPNISRTYYYVNIIAGGTSPSVTHQLSSYRVPCGGE